MQLKFLEYNFFLHFMLVLNNDYRISNSNHEINDIEDDGDNSVNNDDDGDGDGDGDDVHKNKLKI